MDELYFWSSCVQVRLSTCSDMEDARALLIDVERQRLGRSRLWDQWLMMSSRRKSPNEVRLGQRNWFANRAPMDVSIVGGGDVCASTRLTVLPCPCSGLRPKKSSQRLGGLKSLRTPNLSWSDCFNLCKMALPHWTCYNVALCSHRTLFSCTQFSLVVTITVS